MATVIRLSLHGAKKRPYYHIIVTDSRNARNSGNSLETVGKYDPMQPKGSDKRVTLNVEKIKSWLALGAKPSDRVYKFLSAADILPKKEFAVQTKKHLSSEKTQLKLKDKEAKIAKIAAAKAAEIEAAKPVAPTEEVAAPVAE